MLFFEAILAYTQKDHKMHTLWVINTIYIYININSSSFVYTLSYLSFLCESVLYQLKVLSTSTKKEKKEDDDERLLLGGRRAGMG